MWFLCECRNHNQLLTLHIIFLVFVNHSWLAGQKGLGSWLIAVVMNEVYNCNFIISCHVFDGRLRNGSKETLATVLVSTVKTNQLCQLVTDYVCLRICSILLLQAYLSIVTSKAHGTRSRNRYQTNQYSLQFLLFCPESGTRKKTSARLHYKNS